MKLYHGSIVAVKKPVLSKSRPNTDFGKGFYLTTSIEQATRWANIRKGRYKESKAFVSVYEFNESLLHNKTFNVRFFSGVDRDWLRFIVGCRKEKIRHNFDIVMGPVANDRLYLTINMYENGELDEEAAIIQLRSYRLFDQLSFHTTDVLKELAFKEAIEV